MKDDLDLSDQAEAVASRADFLEFLDALRGDLADRPQDWENQDLDSYLNGLRGFVGDIEGYYKNAGNGADANVITWQMAAEILLAATVYE